MNQADNTTTNNTVMTKQELRNELYNALSGMYFLPQNYTKFQDAANVEADNLMEMIEQYAQQGKGGV